MTISLGLIGRLVEVWMIQGIPQEIKVTNITDDEVIGEYRDGTECHFKQKYIIGYWAKPKEQFRRERVGRESRERWAKKKGMGLSPRTTDIQNETEGSKTV